MQTKKMSLSAINGVLSKSEMKKIMAGSQYTPIKCGNTGCDPVRYCEKGCSCQYDSGVYRCKTV